VRESNREFILSYAEDWDPDETVEVRVDGQVEQMTASQALELALDRAGERNLERLANNAEPASHDTRDWIGDIFHLGLGGADCGTTTTYTPSTPGTELDPQFELHEGPVSYTSGTNADRLHVVFSDTMKEGHAVGSIDWIGKAQSFCFPGLLVLENIDGVATNDDLPGELHDVPTVPSP
jgi:hypothetical protein